MRDEMVIRLLIDELMDRLTAFALSVFVVWLLLSVGSTLIKEGLHTRRVRIEQKAKTDALRQEMAMRAAATDGDT